jgi:O-antigen/teichoic acid export membrane protein
MSPASRFAKALAGQWTATLYTAVLSTLLSFALGRVLGPEAFGGYTYVLTLASLFAILQDGGFATLLFREAARPTPGLPPAASLLRLALGHLGLVTACGAALIAVFPLAQKPALFLALGYYALFSAGNSLSAWLKGHGRFQDEARWRAVTRTATALAVGLALLVPDTGVALIFSGWFIGLLAAMALPMAAPVRVLPSLHLDRSIYACCWSFLLISASTTIYFKSDIILLSQLTGNQDQVGQYAAAYRLIEAAALFCAPLTHIFFRMLRVNLAQPRTFRRSFRLMLAVMCVLGVAGTALAMWLGPMIIRLAFGPKYGPAESLCLWLLPALAFILPNAVLTQALVALGRERFYARLTMVTAAANIALNLALIPLLGATGSAVATVATEALLAAGLTVGYRRKDKS